MLDIKEDHFLINRHDASTRAEDPDDAGEREGLERSDDGKRTSNMISDKLRSSVSSIGEMKDGLSVVASSDMK
jgi:hypothetical protein